MASIDCTSNRLRRSNFLLAWWNAAECGGFALTGLWGVDTAIAVDMLQVFALVAAPKKSSCLTLTAGRSSVVARYSFLVAFSK